MGFCVFAITNGMKLGYKRPIVPGGWRFRDYQRYEIGLHVVDRTVGFGVFAITNGMKLDYRRLIVPWVFAFLQLPTV